MAGHKLDEVYHRFQTQLGFHAYAKQAALRPTASTDLLFSLGVPGIGDVVKDRRKHLLKYFDRVDEQVRRQGFIDLVAAFETDLFVLLGRATSGACHVLNAYYEIERPFAEERWKLVRAREDISNLGGYRRLFERKSGIEETPGRHCGRSSRIGTIWLMANAGNRSLRRRP